MRIKWASWLAPVLAVMSALVALGGTTGAQAQSSQRCFAETNLCIEGRIREFWEQNGGLAVFGLPVTPLQVETIEGRSLQVQWFERNRLELHPENSRPYDVLLGRLGADRLAQQGRDWFGFPKGSQQNGCRFFADTGHSVCGAILQTWRANGLEIDGRSGKTEAESLALFGMPLSEPQVETLSDGKQYTVQWFERARFELHPENAAPYDVLLGLLGNEIRAPASSTPTQPADQCADVPDPVDGRIRPSKCLRYGDTAEMDVFGFKPNEPVGYWINLPDGSVYGTVQTVRIGSSGAASGLQFDVSDDLPPGVYSWVFQGTESKHTSIVYFKVIE